MTAFYKNFVKQCAKNGYSESGAAKAIGLSNAAASGWKNGKIPSNTTREKLSILFNVSVEALMKDDSVTEPADIELVNGLIESERAKHAKKLPATPGGELSPAKQKLYDAIDDLTDEQCAKLLGIVLEAKKVL